MSAAPPWSLARIAHPLPNLHGWHGHRLMPGSSLRPLPVRGRGWGEGSALTPRVEPPHLQRMLAALAASAYAAIGSNNAASISRLTACPNVLILKINRPNLD